MNCLESQKKSVLDSVYIRSMNGKHSKKVRDQLQVKIFQIKQPDQSTIIPRQRSLEQLLRGNTIQQEYATQPMGSKEIGGQIVTDLKITQQASLNSTLFRFKGFLYQPVSERFSATSLPRPSIKSNQDSNQISTRSTGSKRFMMVQVGNLPVSRERGTAKSPLSQRWVQKNQEVYEVNNLNQVNKFQIKQRQASNSPRLDLLSLFGGEVALQKLIDRLMKHFKVFQVLKVECTPPNDTNGNKPSYSCQQLDLRNFIYSLRDRVFYDCLYSLFTTVRVEFIRNFLRGQNVNEIKYSALRVYVEKFLRKSSCNNQAIDTFIARIDEHREQFVGEGWFEVFGKQNSLSKILVEVSTQLLMDTNWNQDLNVQTLGQPILDIILNRNDQIPTLPLTYIQFYRLRMHFYVALQKRRCSCVTINMFMQILQRFRQTTQPDVQFLNEFTKNLKQKLLQIYGISQLFLMIKSREQFYSFINDIALDMSNYFLRDLPRRVENNGFEYSKHMSQQMQLVQRSHNFWNFKEKFLQTLNELSDDVSLLLMVKQSFGHLQVLLSISPSLYTDVLHMNSDSQLYNIQKSIQRFVLVVQQMIQDSNNRYRNALKVLNDGYLSSELQLEMLLQFLYHINPQEAPIPVQDIKAFLEINSLDQKFLHSIIKEISHISIIVPQITLFAQEHANMIN